MKKFTQKELVKILDRALAQAEAAKDFDLVADLTHLKFLALGLLPVKIRVKVEWPSV